MDNEPLHLWCAYPGDLLDEDTAAASLRLLSEDEHNRWQKFRFARSRREYLATHALARTALAHHGGQPPEAWRFTQNAHGKPAIEPEGDLHFNLSNARDLVVCLIGKGVEVGVDIEPHARAKSVAEVADRMFSAQELAQLDALDGEQRLDRCLQLWTLKEAYIKARGMGFALRTTGFSFLFAGGHIRLSIDDAEVADHAERWRFCLLQHQDHCIAVMVEGRTAPRLHLWQARPPNAKPAPLQHKHARWFPAE